MKRCFVFMTVFAVMVMGFAVSAGAEDFGIIRVNVPAGYAPSDENDYGEIALARPEDPNNGWILIEVHDKYDSGASLEDYAKEESRTREGSTPVRGDNGVWVFRVEGDTGYSSYAYTVYVGDNNASIMGIQILGDDADSQFFMMYAGDGADISGSGSGSGGGSSSSGCNTGISALAVLGAFMAFRKKSR